MFELPPGAVTEVRGGSTQQQRDPKKLKKVWKMLLMLSILLPTVLCVAMLLGAYDPQALNPAIEDRLPDNLDSVVCTVVLCMAAFGLIFVSQLEAVD